ncbi:MAG: hypothetical protein ACKVKM_12105 [Verrucomicrobiia bacterium]|jgi:hypothetical protein|tara:strand:+ start:290 stop:460 length:171 start_codon:yes stop_codon:yes gene_type:complete
MKQLKQIDPKSLIIGFLLSAVVFLTLGLAQAEVVKVRIIGIDKAAFESWDAIKVSN